MALPPLGDVKRCVVQRLSSVGITDPITIKYKKDPVMQLARYRALSQFKDRPIVWLNTDLPEIARKYGVPESRFLEINCDSVLHEYGHVIDEYARMRDPALQELISDSFTPEGFAEGLSEYLKDGVHPQAKSFDSILTKWKTHLEPPDGQVP